MMLEHCNAIDYNSTVVADSLRYLNTLFLKVCFDEDGAGFALWFMMLTSFLFVYIYNMMPSVMFEFQ